jgi:uncharacterized protein (DUF58 family)
MFNPSWIDFAILMIVVGAVLEQPSIFVLAALLLTIIPVAYLWQRVAPWRVAYTRTLGETRVFVGERVCLSLNVNNHKWLPLAWVRVQDRAPLALPPLEKELAPSHIPLVGYFEQRAALSAFERARWDYHLDCRKRGLYFFGPAQIKTGDVFGLFQREWSEPRTDRLIVYPRLYPLEEWGLPAKEPLGVTKTREQLLEDPTRVRGIRDYQPSDALKHIHWRATARQSELQVKVYDPVIANAVVIALNIQTYPKLWQGVDPDKVESAVSLAASLANFAAKQKYAVGLIANGSWPESDQRLKIMPGRAPHQLRRVLEALAAVTYFITTPMENLLRAETPKLPWGATLVVVTALVTEELLAEMLRLRAVGRQMVLISLDENWMPRELPGIAVRQATVPASMLVEVQA